MLIVALIATVLLLIWMGFFMMGSLPLLVLKHDTPLDASFIRGLFQVHCRAILATAATGAVGYALAGRLEVATALSFVAALGFTGGHWLVSRMDAVRGTMTMTATDAPAIRRFRQLHVAGMLLNVALLAASCLTLARVSL